MPPMGLLLDDQHVPNLRNVQVRQAAQAGYQAFTRSVRRYFPQNATRIGTTYQGKSLPN